MSGKRKKTILLVDDMAVNIQILAEGLKSDYEITFATRGVDALRIAFEQPKPDIILLDVMMPEMNGYSVCAQLKADPRTKDIPVIFITAKDQPEDELKGLGLGAVDYISKPIILELVKARVKTHLTLYEKEEELKRAREALEVRVQERTRELREANLALRNEIVEHKRAKAEVELNESRLTALVELSRLADSSRQGLADYALEEAVRLTKSKVGYLHLVNEDQNSIEVHSWSQKTLPRCKTEQSHYPLDQAGVRADCVRLRKPVVHNDYQYLPDTKGYPEGHFPIFRHMSVPFFSGDKIVAIAGVGNKEEPYNDSDIHQLYLFVDGMMRILAQQQFNERLQLAKENAEAANKAKTAFLSTISHEVRTPLNGILGMADLLLSTSLSQEQQEYIDVVHSAAKNLLAMLNEVIDFSKIEFGDVTTNAYPFEIRPLVQSAVSLFRRQAEEKNLALDLSLDADLPHVLSGDGVRVQKTLVILIGNAVKFTDQGSVSVEVDCEGRAMHGAPESSAGKRVKLRFTVRDTGVGIPAEHMEKLFQAFTQVDDSYSRRFGGIGLGLAMGKRLVESMGGTISFESQLGQGSTFSFTAEFGVPEEGEELGEGNV